MSTIFGFFRALQQKSTEEKLKLYEMPKSDVAANDRESVARLMDRAANQSLSVEPEKDQKTLVESH